MIPKIVLDDTKLNEWVFKESNKGEFLSYTFAIEDVARELVSAIIQDSIGTSDKSQEVKEPAIALRQLISLSVAELDALDIPSLCEFQQALVAAMPDSWYESPLYLSFLAKIRMPFSYTKGFLIKRIILLTFLYGFCKELPSNVETPDELVGLLIVVSEALFLVVSLSLFLLDDFTVDIVKIMVLNLLHTIGKEDDPIFQSILFLEIAFDPKKLSEEVGRYGNV